MAAVKDINGEEWIVSLNTSTIQRIRQNTDIDLLKILEDKVALAKLFGDMEVQMRVLFWTCQNQVQTKFEKPLSLEDWCDRWDGTTLEAGLNTLMEVLARFFPPQKGETLRKGVKAVQEFVDKLYLRNQKVAASVSGDLTDRILDQTEQELMRQLEKDLKLPAMSSASTGGGTSSGGVPESSESIPDHSPPPN